MTAKISNDKVLIVLTDKYGEKAQYSSFSVRGNRISIYRDRRFFLSTICNVCQRSYLRCFADDLVHFVPSKVIAARR